MKKKICFALIILLIIIFILQIQCFASTDQAKLFLSSQLSTSPYATQTMAYAVSTYNTLGYNILGSSPYYTVTGSKSDILNYINWAGNNYAYFSFSHGTSNAFWVANNDYIWASDISGNWHFVFLNHCYSLYDNTFAQAFHTIGYTNRASLGWFDSVTDGASEEWWSYFKNVAGTTNLRAACLSAAGNCDHYTPIRIYGDKDWYGFAW